MGILVSAEIACTVLGARWLKSGRRYSLWLPGDSKKWLLILAFAAIALYSDLGGGRV
jgi:hypothetical protein